MNQDFSSIRVSEVPSGLVVSHSRASRFESIGLVAVCLAALVLSYYLSYLSPPSIFSNDWSLIPICFLGSAGLIALVLRSGTAKSTITIGIDGTIRAGIATWKFPGPITAIAQKTGGPRAPSYWLDFRYGSATVRLPGGTTEGSTMGAAVQINRWSRARVHGAVDPFESEMLKPATSWGTYCGIFLTALVILSVVNQRNGAFLNPHAPLGPWARISLVVFSVLVAIAGGIRWSALKRMGVGRGPGVWAAEIAVTVLLILGGGAIVTRDAQSIEMGAAAATPLTFDAQLHLTKTTTGKGCHRYVILEEPSLAGPVRYCDPHPLAYWNAASEVRVTELRNNFGIQIIEVDRADSY
ncbi:hypothetical protein AB1286_30975 [Trinickia sp. NRRL B-1857]|uniref:hypothetical protein n=1 Tax=Trinickia sp. NRRL B-1857 TaxID=3162879 RepID=UPI003D2ACE86